MGREDQLTRAFVELADTLVDDYDVGEFLQLLVDRCADLLLADAVGVLLVGREDGLGLVAASTDDMRTLELFQRQHEQGPCRDALRTGKQVVEHDSNRAADRWPSFTPRARSLGFVSFHAFPMRTRGQVIGALNLFAKGPRALSRTEVNTAQALADIATIGILHERSIGDARALTEQLEHALEGRTLIEQAKGILMQSQHIDAREAFERLRGYARKRNLRVRDVAKALIDETVAPGRLA